MEDVKVIASRYSDRPKTDPGARLFTIADHIVVDPEKLRSGRMYVGDEFRAVVLTLTPGQAQDGDCISIVGLPRLVHRVRESGEVTMEDGRKDRVKAGMFCVHPRNSVHGVRNDGDDNLTYVALSIGE